MVSRGTKSCNQPEFLNFVTMVTIQIVLELFLVPRKTIVIDILVFGKLSRTIMIFMATTSYNQLDFFNLVTMATNKLVFDINKEVKNKNISFWKTI